MNPVTITSTDQSVRVELEHIGEGWSGDYNSEDPDDTPLVRFTVLTRQPTGEWQQVADASYCTQIPATEKPRELQRLASVILMAVYKDAAAGRSIKRTCERLSWLPEAYTGGI